MHYESFGDGRSIVFLPGWGGDAGEGRDVHEPVFDGRAGRRRIYVDPPGTGKSPADPGITDQDGMLAAILELIDEVVGTERFALAGTSAGGLLSRGIVKRDPSRVLALLLRVPGVIVDRTRRTLPTTAVTKSPGWHEKQRRYYDVADAQADFGFLDRIQGDPATYALREDPAVRFDRPTLIVTGRRDTMTGYADAWSILDDYPQATYVVLDREGHELPVRSTALYRALVADWLDRIEHPDA
ncbi:alpha/beta hydrolase [Kribbella turkmenica]|uniref:Alpha/beta hydrolase n=1 Tax=Kribbella turkmenica TaxID=2530375 RepID=A0A4R4WP97_9ACTN|nr:alpha/beta hydrolase [Kribbella turkmenica]TDD18065.1 alpha/beta hydrolase [Kribbella turkmenica]